MALRSEQRAARVVSWLYVLREPQRFSAVRALLNASEWCARCVFSDLNNHCVRRGWLLASVLRR